MKTTYYLLMVVLSCTVFPLHSQTTNSPTNHFSVFFERGASTLTPTALATLDAIAGNIPAECKILLQGFGDEGEQPSSKLAKDRAMNVGLYLQSQGVAADKMEILQPDHLALARVYEKEIMVQRVNIQLSQNIYTNVQTLLSSLDAEKPNEYRISAKKRITLFTQKGTAISLPQDAFVLADGSLYQGQVQFSVKEAFTYKEMIANSLHTSSDGKLLETGGMIYLSALDTLGRELQLAQGKEITFSLPTEQASLPRMQVFTAQTTENGKMDWQTTDYWTKTTNDRSTPTPVFTNRVVSDVAQLQQAQATIKHFLNFNPQQLPETPQFFMPEPPYKSSYLYRNRAEAEKWKQPLTNESEEDYNARIDKYLKRSISGLKKYDKEVLQYQKDSAAFVQANPAYLSYCQELLKSLSYIREHVYNLTKEDFFAPIEKSVGIVNSSTDIYRLMSGISKLIEKHQYSKLTELVQPLYQLRTESNTAYATIQNIRKNTPYLSSSFYSKDSWSSFARDINEISDKTAHQQALQRKDIESIIYLHNKLLKELPLRELQTNLQPIYQAIQEYIPIITEVERVESRFWEIQKQVFEKEKELGLLTEEEIFNIYNNAMKINRLGWINCDRFVDDVSPRTDLHILADGQPSNSQTTKYYLVFQDIKSIMPFEAVDNKLVVKNIPSGQNVTVVGIRVEGEATASVFTQSGKVGELENRINPIFEAKNIDEVMSFLSKG